MDNDKYFPPPPPLYFPLSMRGCFMHWQLSKGRPGQPTVQLQAKVDDDLHIYHVKVTDRSK